MQYYTPQPFPVQLVYLVTPQEIIDKIDVKAVATGIDGAAETIGSLVSTLKPQQAGQIHQEVEITKHIVDGLSDVT